MLAAIPKPQSQVKPAVRNKENEPQNKEADKLNKRVTRAKNTDQSSPSAASSPITNAESDTIAARTDVVASDEPQSVQRALANNKRRERDHRREDGVTARHEYLGRLVLSPELPGARRRYNTKK